MNKAYAIFLCAALLLLAATCFLTVSTLVSMTNQSLADHDALIAANAKLDTMTENYNNLLKTIGQQPPLPTRVGDK